MSIISLIVIRPRRFTMRRSLCWLLLLCIALPWGCGEPRGNQKLAVTEADGILIVDVGIATFSTPEGWTPNRSDGNTVVILTRVGANRQNPEDMISIDIGKPVSPDAQASANGLAANFAGTVTPLSFQVDGEPAYRVSIPPDYEQLMPRECIVIHHRGQVCFLFGGSRSTADIWAPLSAVAQSWNWK